MKLSVSFDYHNDFKELICKGGITMEGYNYEPRYYSGGEGSD